MSTPSDDPSVRALVTNFQLPDDFTSDEVDSRREAGDETIEFPTFGVNAIAAAAHGLDMLAVHLHEVDSREPVDRLSTAVWDDPPANDGAVRDALVAVRESLWPALIAFKGGDERRTADCLAESLCRLVVLCSDLGLDLGEALARIVPSARA